MGIEARGFASMDQVKQREIASKGGKAAHRMGHAHEWSSEEAREAGRRGRASRRSRQEDAQPDQEAERIDRDLSPSHVWPSEF